MPFRGRELTLFPETDELAPTVLLTFDDGRMTGDEAIKFVRHFLSSLSWVEGLPIQDMEAVDGTSPIWIGKPKGGRIVTPKFHADYLPDPADPKARLALSLYREALYVNSLPYRFLGFFKIVNVCYPDGPKQKAWINGVIDKIDDLGPKRRVEQLRKEGRDVGAYLYESGRCAVAHAFKEPIADPDDPEDRQRLQYDLPVIRALAEWLIEYELGVKSRETIWMEHLYELDGFRRLLGDGVVRALKAGDQLDLASVPVLPRLSLRVRGEPPMAAFEALTAEPAGVEPTGRLVLRCRSDDGLVQALPVLNFASERLEFEPTPEQLFVGDDSSLKSVQYSLDGAAMLRSLISNGQFEIWNAETAELLGRTDPYMPLNIDVIGSIKGIDKWITQLKAREQQLLGAAAGLPAAEEERPS